MLSTIVKMGKIVLTITNPLKHNLYRWRKESKHVIIHACQNEPFSQKQKKDNSNTDSVIGWDQKKADLL